MNFDKLNKASKILVNKTTKEVTIDAFYEVTDIRKIDTKFGPKIIAKINNEFNIFLPPRMLKYLKRMQIFSTV